MKDNKKQVLLSVVGILILVLAIVGVTYAFFSYVYLGEEENTVRTGTIVFTASDKTLELTNVFPTTLENTTDVATVSVQGHTTYEYGIDFTVKAIEVTSQNEKIIPTVVVTREEVDGITYTDGKDLVTTYDKNNRLTTDTVLCTGNVAVNTTIGSVDEPTKILTLSVFYDKDEYHISDNTKEVLIQEGMLPENYAGEIISTDDWNSLSSSVTRATNPAYSFRIQVIAVEGANTSKLQTRVERTLPLTEPDVDGTRYVYGETVDNNYVWYSGKMWRIVALNSDGTVKLVTQNAMTSVAWNISSKSYYSTSQIRSWLNTEFLPTINENLIVDSNWDYTTYASFPTEKDTENAISVPNKVGLLSIYDFMMTGGTNDSSTTKTFLNNGYFWWTSSPKSSSGVWRVVANGIANSSSPTYAYGARPSVNLKSDITLTGEGNGTIETPYMLEGDIEVGQANELLSSRISGEYIEFNNIKYRIVGVENGLTKITMADYSINKNTLSTLVAFGASTDEITFSTTYGIGKYLDDWYNATSETDASGTYTGLYLSETAKTMIATPSDGVRWYAGPDDGTIYDYTKATQGTAIEATIGLGRYGEMFSTQFGNGYGTSDYTCLMTKYSGSNVWNIDNYGTASNFSPTYSDGARPSMYLKSNVKITGGSGMPHDPYEIEIEIKTLNSAIEIKLAPKLTEPDVDGTRYVTGETVDNNYVWYSGKMWRIVALNSDGTVKLVTQDNMTTIAWATKSNIDYSQSQIRSWLNTEFIETINDKLIVQSNWDYTTYDDFPTEKDTENAISVSNKVGLLSVYDYMMTGGTNSQSTSKTFLNNGYYWWMASPISRSYVWYVGYYGYAKNDIPTESYGARPSVNLKSDITLTGEGNGEIETPYMLEGDIKVGQSNELLSSRISGEYIKFNNTKYRIVGAENGLTKITMADYSVNKNTLTTSIKFGTSDDEVTFSTTYGIGKYLDDWYNATSENDTSGIYTGLYLSQTAKAMIATPDDGVRWYVGPNGGTKCDYTKATQGTAIEATIGLGRYGEMFSTQFGTGYGSSTNTWPMTKYSDLSVWGIMRNGYASYFSNASSYGARPSMYLKSNVKITGGSGMPHEPYTISQ